jgi:hypothetical protein
VPELVPADVLSAPEQIAHRGQGHQHEQVVFVPELVARASTLG